MKFYVLKPKTPYPHLCETIRQNLHKTAKISDFSIKMPNVQLKQTFFNRCDNRLGKCIQIVTTLQAK
jgi:hypothetical protein